MPNSEINKSQVAISYIENFKNRKKRAYLEEKEEKEIIWAAMRECSSFVGFLDIVASFGNNVNMQNLLSRWSLMIEKHIISCNDLPPEIRKENVEQIMDLSDNVYHLFASIYVNHDLISKKCDEYIEKRDALKETIDKQLKTTNNEPTK